MRLFNNNSEVYQSQKTLTRIYISYYILEVIRSLMSGVLRSVGHEKIVTIYLFVIYVVYTFGVLIIAVKMWGVYGAIYTMTTANFLGSLVGILIFAFMNVEKKIENIVKILEEDKKEFSNTFKKNALN